MQREPNVWPHGRINRVSIWPSGRGMFSADEQMVQRSSGFRGSDIVEEKGVEVGILGSCGGNDDDVVEEEREGGEGDFDQGFQMWRWRGGKEGWKRTLYIAVVVV